ncbi:MAG: WD40 repeat domain-containing protein [Planctomycetaceae bacterium]
MTGRSVASGLLAFVALLHFGVWLNPVASDDPGTLAEGQRRFKEFAGHAEYVYEVRYSADDRFVVTASGDNTAQLRDAVTLKTIYEFLHDAAVYTAAFSPDGSRIATGTGDGHVTLWDTQTGRIVQQEKAHQDAVYSLDFSPDGQFLATGGGSTDGGDTRVQIRTVRTLQRVRDLPGHRRQVYGVVYSPDGKTIATSSSDRTIRLWNTTTAEFIEFNGHTSDVYRCAFSDSADQLASTSQDGTVRIWNATSGELLTTLSAGKDPTYSVAVTAQSNNRLLVSAVSGDGHFRTWSWTSSQQVTPIENLNLVRSALYTVAVDSEQKTFIVAGENGQLLRQIQ